MKNLKFVLMGMLAMMITFIGCQKDELKLNENEQNQESSENVVHLSPEDEIVLGEQLENPYSLENMAKAFDIVNPNKLKSTKSLNATHLYVRFLPENAEEMEILLSDTALSLYDYPLDYEIIEDGQYYHDPEIPTDKITWQYTVVSADYTFPNVKHELLSELYIPEEDEADVEEEALTITGNLSGNTLKSTNGWRRSKYRPEGNIFVQDDVLNRDVPLRNVKVRIRNWFRIDNRTTDANGHFRAMEYRGNVDIIVIFESSRCKLRSTLINIFGTADKKLANEVKSLNIVLSREGRNTTTTPLPSGYRNFSDDKVWAWATIFNAVEDYHGYCVSENIGKPQDGLRIWVNRNNRKSKRGEGVVGAAPMFHRGLKYYSLNFDKWWHYFVNYLGSPITLEVNYLANVFHAFLPDIVIGYGSDNVNSADINEVVFHELSHASHYIKVGNVFWSKYINYIITNNGYGDGSGHNFDICALGEAWGYHMGWFLSRDKYGINAPVSLNIEENFTPLARSGNPGMLVDLWGNRSSWIPAGLMHDLTETNSDHIQGTFWDDADGYTNEQIFNALDWGIESPQAFRDRLLRENSNRDQTDVNSLFEAYFFN